VRHPFEVFAIRAYPWVEMIRKATLLVLLLLLVSVQALAANCDVRCSMAGTTTSGGHTALMVHFGSRSSHASSENSAATRVAATPLCVNDACKSDWSFVQTPVVHGLDLSSMVFTALDYNESPVPTGRWDFGSHPRRRHSLFDPVIVSPRV